MLELLKESKSQYIASFAPSYNKLNITNASAVKDQLIEQFNEGCKCLILDFNGLLFIDSTGFGALVSAYNHANNMYAKITLCNIPKDTMELVKITKLDQIFEIYDSLETAKERS